MKKKQSMLKVQQSKKLAKVWFAKNSRATRIFVKLKLASFCSMLEIDEVRSYVVLNHEIISYTPEDIKKLS